MCGGPALELVYGVTGILDYLLAISSTSGPMASTSLEAIYSDPRTQVRLKATFTAIAEHEQTLVKRLLGHMTSEKLVKRGLRVIGEEKANDLRTPIISFVVVKGETGDAISGKDIVELFDAQGTVSRKSPPSSSSMAHYESFLQMGIRYGHFAAHVLLGTLEPKVDVKNGALVRISLLHYNTIEEVDRLIEVLDVALGFGEKTVIRARL
jgi:selenocysteine lyase/cysteine desulfurase